MKYFSLIAFIFLNSCCEFNCEKQYPILNEIPEDLGVNFTIRDIFVIPLDANIEK